MPIYAYECKSCGKQAEYIQKFSDEPKTECEHCGGPLEKLISAPAFHLKGGGWYADGYASTGGKKPDGSKSESAAPAKSGSEGGSSAKPSGGDSSSKGSGKGGSSSGSGGSGGSASKGSSATGSD